MAELADALDLGSSALRRAGSIPVSRTTNKKGLQANACRSFLFVEELTALLTAVAFKMSFPYGETRLCR